MCGPQLQNIPQGDGSEGSALTPDQVLARNQPYMKPGAGPFQTQLPPEQEGAFRNWVSTNKVAFDPGQQTPDYDMRGFFQQTGGAGTQVNPNDGRVHYPDQFKTPYDLTFSKESQWADPEKAPAWNKKDQLAEPNGRVIYDEKARKYRPTN